MELDSIMNITGFNSYSCKTCRSMQLVEITIRSDKLDWEY